MRFDIKKKAVQDLKPQAPFGRLHNLVALLNNGERDASQFMKDLFREETIVINGKLFNNGTAVGTNNEALQAELVQAFLNDKSKPFSDEELELRKSLLSGLHQGAAADALAFVEGNFAYDYRGDKKTIGLQFASSLRTSSLKRDGDVFSYETEIPVFGIHGESNTGIGIEKSSGKLGACSFEQVYTTMDPLLTISISARIELEKTRAGYDKKTSVSVDVSPKHANVQYMGCDKDPQGAVAITRDDSSWSFLLKGARSVCNTLKSGVCYAWNKVRSAVAKPAVVKTEEIKTPITHAVEGGWTLVEDDCQAQSNSLRK